MWPTFIVIMGGGAAWIFYEQAGARIVECEGIKKKIPTRQVAMDQTIFNMQTRQVYLKVFLVVDLLILLGLWVANLWE